MKFILFNLAMKLNIPDIYSFIQISKKHNQVIDKLFWKKRLIQDYQINFEDNSFDYSSSRFNFKFYISYYYRIYSSNFKNIHIYDYCSFGDLNLVKKIFQEYECEIDKNKALSHAAFQGHLKIVEFLYEKGADIHHGQEEPLRYASDSKYIDVMDFLINKGCKMDIKNNYILRKAVIYDNLKVIEYLVKKGIDIHADDDYALRQAIIYKKEKIVNYLIEQGAKINKNE